MLSLPNHPPQLNRLQVRKRIGGGEQEKEKVRFQLANHSQIDELGFHDA